MVEGKRYNFLAAQIMAKTHEIIAGVGVDVGGKDEGPDPHELVEAALAACTVITVQMYANRKEWPLQSTDVKIYIESEGAKTEIVREVHFKGDLTDEQRSRLLDIANKCPIHRLLSSEVHITTKPV
jgi:putative redox protein